MCVNESLIALVAKSCVYELSQKVMLDLNGFIFFFFKQKTAYEIGLGIPAEPLFRSYANHFYRSAHKFEQICRHRLRRQNVGYSNFSQPQSHLSFCVLLQYLVERRRVVTQLGKLD